MAHAIDVGAVVPGIAGERKRQSAGGAAAAQILFPRAAEEKRDLLFGSDHLVGLDAVLVVGILGGAVGNRVVADVGRGARHEPGNVWLDVRLYVIGDGLGYGIELGYWNLVVGKRR